MVIKEVRINLKRKSLAENALSQLSWDARAGKTVGSISVLPETEPPAPSPGELATTWDAAHKDDTITLSGGNLTSAVTTLAAGNVRSTESHGSGRYAFRFQVTYPGAAGDEEIYAGLCPTSYDPASSSNSAGEIAGSMLYAADGYVYADSFGTAIDTGLTVASGAWMYGRIDFDEGEIQFSNTPFADDLIDPQVTFTPNTALFLVNSAYSGAEPSPVTCTLDATYSAGTCAAWNTPE